MKPKYLGIFVLATTTSVFYSCKSSTTQDTLLPPEGNICPNSHTNQPTDNGKEKLLDMALKTSGRKVSAEERNTLIRMLSLSEDDLIRGLSVFAELSNGRYPSKLDTKSTLEETDGLGAEVLRDVPQKVKKQKVQDIFFAAAYHDKLVREQKNVAYYGDTVTVGDADAVLVRWKESKGRYRVIFGDLRTETIAAEELAKLEKPSSK